MKKKLQRIMEVRTAAFLLVKKKLLRYLDSCPRCFTFKVGRRITLNGSGCDTLVVSFAVNSINAMEESTGGYTYYDIVEVMFLSDTATMYSFRDEANATAAILGRKDLLRPYKCAVPYYFRRFDDLIMAHIVDDVHLNFMLRYENQVTSRHLPRNSRCRW